MMVKMMVMMMMMIDVPTTAELDISFPPSLPLRVKRRCCCCYCDVEGSIEIA